MEVTEEKERLGGKEVQEREEEGGDGKKKKGGKTETLKAFILVSQTQLEVLKEGSDY